MCDINSFQFAAIDFPGKSSEAVIITFLLSTCLRDMLIALIRGFWPILAGQTYAYHSQYSLPARPAAHIFLAAHIADFTSSECRLAGAFSIARGENDFARIAE